MVRLTSLAPTALLAFLLPSTSHAQTFACNDYANGRDGTVSSALTFNANADPLVTDRTITLTNTNGVGKLCTLFYISLSEDGSKEFYVPVGRSYDGNNWERVGGKHARLVYTCSGGSCTVTVPNAAGPEAVQYYMTAYQYTLTGPQTWARFLEKATFGPRTSDIQGASGTEADMAAMITAQFAKPETSHREYFRQRLNPRSLETYKYGRSGPHPCEVDSRWRNFAFTRKDKVMSIGPFKDDWPMTTHNATLQERDFGGTKKYAWLFAGHVRTILDAQPKWTATPGSEIALGTYRVCAVDEVAGVEAFPNDADEDKRQLYARFKIQDFNDNHDCKHVFGGNPKVYLDENYMGAAFEIENVLNYTETINEGNPYILDMTTGFASADLLGNEIGYDPTAEGGVGHEPVVKPKGNGVVLLKKTNYAASPNDVVCAAVPDPYKADGRSMGWEYSPYYEGMRHPDWDPSYRSVLDPEVFAKVSATEYRIHDRRFLPLKNTVDDPLMDGGGTQTLESVFIMMDTDDEDDATLQTADHDENPRTPSTVSGNEQGIYCSNSRPNVFNEPFCKLSREENACVREASDDEDTVAVVDLKAEVMAAINSYIYDSDDNLLAAGVPAEVTGLNVADSTSKPCTMNGSSRWMCDATPTDSGGCVTASGVGAAGSNTVAAFKHLIKYAVTNNDEIMDLRMYEATQGMACDAADDERLGFSVFLTEELPHNPTCRCWINIHPQDRNVYLVKDEATQAFISIGQIDWNTVGTTAEFLTWQGNSANAGKWGRRGDKKTLQTVLNDLDVYSTQGGLPVTQYPTSKPSGMPSSGPTDSSMPSTTQLPSSQPSLNPSISNVPSQEPSISSVPSISVEPSSQPSSQPSMDPSISSAPSDIPSVSSVPSTAEPDGTNVPSSGPSSQPSSIPSLNPSISYMPSENPSISGVPSSQPSSSPSYGPSFSGAPSDVPSSTLVPTLPPSQLSHVARTIHDTVADQIANDEAITHIVLETQMTSARGGVLVCGSDGEIESDIEEDDYFDYWNWRLDSSKPESEQKKTVWTNIVLTSEDQLCQRTAWALSQIFQISPSFLGYNSLSEAHTNYYDGFVRNCNKSYKETMKTIAFSVKMGMQLSHVGSASIRTAYDSSNRVLFPDENYARESMQLETVGLDMLNLDGTLVLDRFGNNIPTYDTNDILTFARVWTGFDYSERRGNYEEKDPNKINWNDPMTLRDGERHDWFPKKDLYDGWIGDRYPLCSDLPDKAFLKTGAKYVLLGRSSKPRYQFDKTNWDGNDVAKKLILSESSNLYSELCADGGSGTCSYPTVVKFTEDIACFELECDLDTVRVVQVAQDVFYEYVRMPCVHHAFFEDDTAKAVWAGDSNGASMCAHPSQPVATTTCCPTGGEISCKYHGEYVTWETNQARCSSASSAVCSAKTSISDAACPGQKSYNSRLPSANHFQWSESSCSVKIKVRLDSMVALVHEAPGSVVRYVDNSVGNMNYFHIPWPKDAYAGDELFPTIDNFCGEQTCVEQDDWTCLCDVKVINSAYYDAGNINGVDADDILENLKIGAFPPSYYGDGVYSAGATLSSDSTVTVYHTPPTGGYSEDTIFRLQDETDEFFDFGEKYKRSGESPVRGYVYLKNLVSNIRIGDPNNDYYTTPIRKPLIMRNPLMFHDLVAPEIRDAHYEIDAVIHHLTSHQNAPPFVAHQLIQHFGIANPSPGMIERVATAYKEGKFTHTGTSTSYGDERYSNLNAVVAAILLDKEATASTLDADPTSGGLKEPIIKVLQFMRAMEYKQTAHDRNIYPKLSGMVAKVGQMAYESPDQFSFFLPDYSPPGQFAQGGLNAPPAQVLSMSTTVATVEGFFELARSGLSGSRGGFGANVFGWGVLEAHDYSKSVGFLGYSPSGNDAQNVQLTADLLTGGRLSPDAVSSIETAVGSISGSNKNTLAQQLIATSPEFHTSNIATRTGTSRTPTPQEPRTDDPYKAVVILFAAGGMDSFNVLTPHPTCSLYRSYRANRDLLALRDRDLLPITNGNSEDDPEQPCDMFGVHNQIPILKQIYDNGHGQFHANIGHLHKPVTKGNWYTETRTHLFSHKTMEREAQLVDAFQEDGWSTGVAGRMLDVLQRRGMSVNAIGIDGKGPIIEGNPALGRLVDVISSGGVNTLTRSSLIDTGNDVTSIEPMMEFLNQETDLKRTGVFANYWSQNLVDVLDKTDNLSDLLATVDLNKSFEGSIGRKLAMVAKLMILNVERNVNRDVFLLTNGGHDGHSLSKENLAGLLPDINSGMKSFYEELGSRNMLDQVTFVLMSEFGRTITPNSGRGSDHAWGGNAYVWGGEIRGGRILGQYPSSLDNTDEANIGRGRLIPSRSWESMWYGIANWFGITDESEMLTVLPNNGNMGCQLYTDLDMYTVGNTTINGCNDRQITMKLSMLLNEPRYLTGLEQKRICRAAIALTIENANTTSRCVVTDQRVIVYFDENRRRLISGGEIDERMLTTIEGNGTTVQGYGLEATVGFEYDNPNGTLNGTEYVEDPERFTQGLDEAITCSGDTSSGRRLTSDENCVTNCQAVTEFICDCSDSPSTVPSMSSVPSSAPSSLPSSAPSESPSISIVPSPYPTSSSKPSSIPSESPSISQVPSQAPSFEPSVSLMPTVPQPSSKPSVAPSGRPTKLCPTVIDECYNGGVWSPYTCECLCVSPYCPDDDGVCRKTNGCPANYQETLFDDQPAPWFQYGSSCMSTYDLPSSVSAIYLNKEDCCAEAYRDDVSGCIARPAEIEQLFYHGKLILTGLTCPESGSKRAASTGNIARSILSVLCSQSGLTCAAGDKVIVTKFCGFDYESEAVYSVGTRRLSASTDDDVVEFTFISQNIDYDVLKGIEAVLSAYLSGTSLQSFVTDLLADIQANNPTASLSAVTSIVYEALNAFIAGLGLYYPAWGNVETCLSDGNQEPYMNRDYSSWLYEDLEGCCQRYYGWDVVGCKLRNAEKTLVSGSISTVDPTSDLYFPDWGKTDTCIKGGAPPYMKKQPQIWLYSTLGECCRAYYGWEGGYYECMASEGGDPPTQSPITEAWYVNWQSYKCVESCDGSSPCGGKHKPWDILHSSKKACCDAHLSWKGKDCMDD